MFQISDAVEAALWDHETRSRWHGTIRCTNGHVYTFGPENLVGSTGDALTINRNVTDGVSLEIGTVYAASLSMDLRLAGVSRYELYDAEITPYFEQEIGSFSKWGDVTAFEWNDLSTTQWGGTADAKLDIKMGVFTVSEVNRSVGAMSIVAYDNMVKLEKKFSAPSRTPQNWLSYISGKTGVAIEDDSLTEAIGGDLAVESVEDLETFRDLLAYYAAAEGKVAFCNRSGELCLRSYGTTPSKTFNAGQRYTSNFSDFQTYYTGLYGTYKQGALSEYVNIVPDDGLVYNLGVNPFLQFNSTTTRKNKLKKILAALSVIRYVPFSVSMPCYPVLDPMDVVAFTDNQTTEEDYGAITNITYRANGKMDISCAGENPKLNVAKNRYTKNIEGLLDGTSTTSGSVGTSDFWMVFDDNSGEPYTISGDWTVVASLNLTLTTDHTKSQLNFTVDYVLDADATIEADVQIDDVSVYTISEDQAAGKRSLTITCGLPFEGADTHECKVLLRNVDVVAEEAAEEVAET